MTIESFCIISEHRIYGVDQSYVDIYITCLIIPGLTCWISVMTNMSFDGREYQLNRVIVWWIRRKELSLHPTNVRMWANNLTQNKNMLTVPKYYYNDRIWILQLSITFTEFQAGKGFIWSKRPSTNSRKSSVLYDPSTIFMDIIPLMEMAGRTEYLMRRDWNMKIGSNYYTPSSM